MEEQAEETLSVKTISDDEFDPNQFDNEDDEDEGEGDEVEEVEWDSVSQISRATSETSTLTAVYGIILTLYTRL